MSDPERHEPRHDARHEARPEAGGEDRASRFRRLGRRFLGENEDGRLRLDAREIVHTVLEGGDRAKTEVVRAVAREVRNYLEESGLKDDVHNLLTNYSVEVKASVHLRRLADAEKGDGEAVPTAAQPTAPPPAPAPTPAAEPTPGGGRAPSAD